VFGFWVPSCSGISRRAERGGCSVQQARTGVLGRPVGSGFVWARCDRSIRLVGAFAGSAMPSSKGSAHFALAHGASIAQRAGVGTALRIRGYPRCPVSGYPSSMRYSSTFTSAQFHPPRLRTSLGRSNYVLNRTCGDGLRSNQPLSARGRLARR
jgi:hypothetical protein